MSRLSIAHIVNPVIVPESSDLFIAQPITFAAMKLAKELAGGSVDVEQYAACFPEDEEIIPPHLKPTRRLDRSVLDFDPVHNQKKLPLLADILERLAEESEADYFVYTNVDIGLQPHFYLALQGLIEQGCDAFIINRRTIFPAEEDLAWLPLLFAELGKNHPGSDCFVFQRSLLPVFDLGRISIGGRFSGLSLRANFMAHSRRFIHFRDLHLTFHIGDDRVWKEHPESSLHNLVEVEQIFTRLNRRTSQIGQLAEFTDLYHSFLFRKQLILEEIAGDKAHPLLPIVKFIYKKVNQAIKKLQKSEQGPLTPLRNLLIFVRNNLMNVRKSIIEPAQAYQSDLHRRDSRGE